MSDQARVVIDALEVTGPAPNVGRLANAAGIDVGSMAQLVATAEAQGFVRRDHGRVTLTDDGEDARRFWLGIAPC